MGVLEPGGGAIRAVRPRAVTPECMPSRSSTQAIAYAAAAASMTAVKPLSSAMSAATMEPVTDAYPLTPHSHGTRSGLVAPTARIPAGNGIPMSRPSGAMDTTATATRAASGSPRTRSIGGTTPSPYTTAKMARMSGAQLRIRPSRLDKMLHVKFQHLCGSLDHEILLRILGSPDRHVGPDNGADSADHRRDSQEVPGTAKAFQHLPDWAGVDGPVSTGRIHLIDRRFEYIIDAVLPEYSEIPLGVDGVGTEVFVLAELSRIQKKGSDESFAEPAGALQKRFVATVHASQRGHKRHRLGHGRPGSAHLRRGFYDAQRALRRRWRCSVRSLRRTAISRARVASALRPEIAGSQSRQRTG